MRATYLRRGSAGSELSGADVEAITMVENDVIHLTGVTPALSKSARDAWAAAARQAADRGCLVSLDINYRSALTSVRDARSSFDLVRTHARLIMASPDEVAAVTGRENLSPEQAALVLQELAAPDAEIVVKDGANGSLHLASNGTITLAAAVSVEVEDLVGAGDAFAAGYLSGLLDGVPVPARLARGHACAAFVVSSRGDWEGAPRRAELELAQSLAEVEVHR
jgi:2-dehydro-3-deoxygluconokinase